MSNPGAAVTTTNQPGSYGNLAIPAGQSLNLNATSTLVVNVATNATSGNTTVNALSGYFDTGNLTTANNTTTAFLLTNSQVGTGDLVVPWIAGGNYTVGNPSVNKAVAGVAGGNVTFTLINAGTALPLDGSVRIGFLVLRAS